MKRKMIYGLSMLFLAGGLYVGAPSDANAGYPCNGDRVPKRGNNNWLFCTGGGTDCFRCVNGFAE
jgi:hypothetical protein